MFNVEEACLLSIQCLKARVQFFVVPYDVKQSCPLGGKKAAMQLQLSMFSTSS
jgi:hypothetical protein